MTNIVKILSIDGGGIRGVIPAMILTEIEKRTGKTTAELFDFMAGTSTGAILALALNKPSDNGSAEYTAKELVGLYETKGPLIFQRRGSKLAGFFKKFTEEKYSSMGIETVLNEYFGDVLFSKALTEILITSYDIEARRPRYFCSWEAGKMEDDALMKDIGRATSAAPTYFEPAKIPTQGPLDYVSLIDGGVFANNPAICAYIDARTRYPRETKFLITSLGTGVFSRRLRHEDVVNWGLAQWARPLLDIVLDGVSDSVHFYIDKAHRSDYTDLEHYYRFQVKLTANQESMDDASPNNIRALKVLAADLIEDAESEIDDLCQLLTSS